SAATIIAMAGDEVLMSPAAVMMIHNPWVHAAGVAEFLRHMAGVLDEIKEAIINAYEIKTGLSRDEPAPLMDGGTSMRFRKAEELGFAGGILSAYEPGPDSANDRAAPAYAVSLLAVLNMADASLRRLVDVWKAHNGGREADLQLQLELIKLKEVKDDDA